MVVSKLAAQLGRKVLPFESTSGLISFPVEGPALSNKAYTPVRSFLKIMKFSNQAEGGRPFRAIIGVKQSYPLCCHDNIPPIGLKYTISEEVKAVHKLIVYSEFRC